MAQRASNPNRHRRRGLLALGCALVVLASACADRAPSVGDDEGTTAGAAATSDGATATVGTSGDDGNGATETAGDAGGQGDGTGTDGGTVGGGDTGGGDGGTADAGGGEDTAAPTEPPVATDDLGRVGANGKPMLRSTYPRLLIEVDVQQGAEPDQAALDHLAQTLRGVADKPEGVVFSGGDTFTSDRTEWTSQDLRAVADQHRNHRSTADTVVLYLLYVRGSFYADGSQTNAIGVTYNASEIGVFPERWRGGLGALLGSNRAVERAVLVHELGHALGLVNLTYTSDIDHEDPDHPGHSSSRGSVMYWAIESTAIGQVFSGPPPDAFDDADRADLEGLKRGRY